jgi:hypothetical protein
LLSSGWPVERDRAAVAFVEARQAVEERGLAGAVRSDQTDDLPRIDAERDAVQRDDAAEANGDIGDLEQPLPAAGLRGLPHRTSVFPVVPRGFD